MDSLVGTSGNDTFIADNSNSKAQQTSAADSIDGGAGINTLKIFADGVTPTATVLPASIKNIQTLYLNGDASGLDVSSISSVTALQLDAYAASKTYTVKNQSVSLANHTAGGLTITIDSGTSAAQTVSLNAVGKSGAAETVDLKGTNTSAALSTAGTASVVTLTNTGAKLASLTIGGSANLTLDGAALTASTMTKIDASAATAKVSLDLTAAVTDKTFTFTGGAGNDTVKLKAAEFGTLTSGAQLDGGAGTDTLQINDTTPAYSALNKVANFEVLQVGTDATTVDIGQLTSFNQFSVASGALTETFNNAKSTSTFAIDNSAATTSVTISNKVGETSTSVAIDNGAGASKTLGTLALTGVSNVALSSTGVATKAGAANVITTFSNGDNSNITLTGDTALTLTLSGTNTGSKLDGSAFTGVLTATGSAKADVIIGGTAADVLTTGGGVDTLTGGAGKDTFQITGAAAGTASAPVTITDFVSGTDLVKILKGAGKVAVAGTPVVTSAKVDVSAATTLAGALDLAAAGDGSANAAVKWLVYGSDTYIVVDNSNNATLQTADAVIKLTGITSIVTSTDIAIY